MSLLIDEFESTVGVGYLRDHCRGGRDVYRAAYALGVSTIEHAPMVEAGRLDFDDSGPVVRVNARASHRTARFIVMHELGHLLLSRESLKDTVPHSSSLLERVCDDFAASTLLPDGPLLACTAASMTLGALRTLALQYAVEATVVADRIASLHQSTFWLLELHRHPDRRHWVPTKVAGSPWPFPTLPTVDAGAIGYLDGRNEAAVVHMTWMRNELTSRVRVHCQGDVGWALVTPEAHQPDEKSGGRSEPTTSNPVPEACESMRDLRTGRDRT